MVAATFEAAPAAATEETERVNWALVATIAGAVLLALTGVAAALSQQILPYVSAHNQQLAGFAALVVAVLAPVIFTWRRAIADGQLPLRSGAAPHYEHVSGWGAILLLAVIGSIGWLVWWAAGSDDANRRIHAEWGTWVVVGLSVAFILVAAAPFLPRLVRFIGLERAVTGAASFLSSPIDWIGRWLSSVDSFLVFAIACAAGCNRQNFFLRYAILLSVIGACAVLGYYWQAPWSFGPIAWGFVVAFSVSRRWAWIEQDRELAMLNPTLSQQHIRVGFSQNLRDEALVVFLSMFLLVPLALRQSQLYASALGLELFSLHENADVHSLSTWIAFYGTELAKAVPFVDWAEIYHVEGDAPVSAESPFALHTIFATRVLIDLVFLAALLQAISSASRDSQQRDLFYRKQAISRLDPFTEPEAFRSLVRRNSTGEWEQNGEHFTEFPKYDFNRLAELTAHREERVRRAAEFLLERDGVESDPHYRLSARAADKSATPEQIQELLHVIEQAGPRRNSYQLALARRRLAPHTKMTMVRRHILQLIVQAPHDRDRTEALISAMVGVNREYTYQSRELALQALALQIGVNLRVREAIEQVAAHDSAKVLRTQAAALLKEHPETPD